tara:strand:+ start:684 stop:2858 length:2175 start_codon:yes stop_codon:yes gene_type:complete
MIKKIFFSFLLTFSILFAIILTILSTIGIETDRFNRIIINQVEQRKNVRLNLKTIDFKLDLKKLSLFLETNQPNIIYRDIPVPSDNLKVYIDFLSLFKKKIEIKKINLTLSKLNIDQIGKLSKLIKPSNFKNFLNNKIKKTNIISEIEIFFNEDGEISNFLIKGKVEKLEANILDNLNLSKANFSFIADKEDILIKKIFGNIDTIKISNGDIKLDLRNGLKLKSNFETNINIDQKNISIYKKILNKQNLINNIQLFNGNFNNNVSIDLDETYKVKNFKYNFSGQLKKSEIKFTKSVKNTYIDEELSKIILSDSLINFHLSPKILKLEGEGNYSFDDVEFSKFDFKNKFFDEQLHFLVNFDYRNTLNLDLINYKKSKKNNAKIFLDFKKNKDFININKINYIEKDNLINFEDLKFKDKNLLSFKTATIKTPNNDFSIIWDKKIVIKGNEFDADFLPKFLNQQSNENIFKEINKTIEINFKKINAPLSEKIKDFRLIGKIEKGKFVKITSKGDFGGNNFLDISVKTNKDSNIRFLEIYSDLPRPLLTEYSFFNGLSGGKLLFTSLIDGSKSNSKIKIENFKVINAPGLIKLLSLADLGGLADLAKGEGLSFDILEINIEREKGFLKINEILALGPSMSVLMQGYRDQKGLTSLRGTLIPAKTLNNLISKIPVVGKIVIPKEVGEGLFGISFKMKGPKNDIKTTINPIRTLTPRFIQKIVDKRKGTN